MAASCLSELIDDKVALGMTHVGGGRFAFYAKRFSPRKASIRLRVLEPLAALREAGVAVARCPLLRRPIGYDVVVISKAFGRRAMKVAKAVTATRSGLIFDICDNRFANNRCRKSVRHNLRAINLLCRADLVTVPTERMGRLLIQSVPEISDRVRIVPDMLDDMSGPAARLSPIARWRLARLDDFLARHGDALHCVWFGNNMPGVAGLCQLHDRIAELERFALRQPVTLTIISNDSALYRRASAQWGIPHHYIPWALTSFPHALRRHRVAIIPVPRNDYTAGKSINRPATAMMAGLGVIADSIESYEELRPFIVLDDWQAGLVRYAFDWAGERDRLAAGRAYLDGHYGRTRIAQRWADVLREAAARRNVKG
jgi:hypothetical protein